MERPSTSKPRGTCKYYSQPSGCFAGRTCKFLHVDPNSTSSPGPGGQQLTPYDKAKVCRFYAKGYCKRGDKCWFRHEVPQAGGVVSPQNRSADMDMGTMGKAQVLLPADVAVDEDLCCICFEKPVTYGLLGGCSHVFCLVCIRQWRDPSGKSLDVVDSGVTKKCPMCRAPSRFITPSSMFWPTEDPRKAEAIARYKESMARTPCRYFEDSKKPDKKHPRLPTPFCPFGKDCFYRHTNADGTPYTFTTGTDINMRRYRLATRGSFSLDSGTFHATANTLAGATLPFLLHQAQIRTTRMALRRDRSPPPPDPERAVRGLLDSLNRVDGEDMGRAGAEIGRGLLSSLDGILELAASGESDILGMLDLNGLRTIAESLRQMAHADAVTAAADDSGADSRVMPEHVEDSGRGIWFVHGDLDAPLPNPVPPPARRDDDLDSMPELQSVSNSSEDDSDSEWSDAEEEESVVDDDEALLDGVRVGTRRSNVDAFYHETGRAGSYGTNTAQARRYADEVLSMARLGIWRNDGRDLGPARTRRNRMIYEIGGIREGLSGDDDEGGRGGEEEDGEESDDEPMPELEPVPAEQFLPGVGGAGVGGLARSMRAGAEGERRDNDMDNGGDADEDSSDEDEEDESGPDELEHALRNAAWEFVRGLFSRGFHTQPERGDDDGESSDNDENEDREDETDEPPVPNASPLPIASTSSRFSTVVERERERSPSGPVASREREEEVNDEEDDEDMPQLEEFDNTENQNQTREDPQTQPSVPPFVTDGRGRVVWSSSPSTSATTPSDAVKSRPRDEEPAVVLPLSTSTSTSTTQAVAPGPGECAGVMLSSGPEFTTDGRGRVIGAAGPGSGHGGDVSQIGIGGGAARNSIFARMLGSLF